MSLRLEVFGPSRLLLKIYKGFFKVASSLTNLLKNAIKLEGTNKCERAFEELGQRLTTAPILTLLVEGKKCTAYSDALKNGLGCVLMQEDKVIAYAS